MTYQLYEHHFQPIVNMSNNEIKGLEGLLRAKLCARPESLFQKAIESKCLLQLDMMSIENLLRIYSKKQSSKLNSMLLFVNVFPSTVKSLKFYERFNEMLVAYRLNPENIVFELNEMEAILDYDLLRKSIEHFRNLHVKFALDDFGEGMASLKRLIELEPDYIKLDKYFARNLSKSNKKQQLISVILNFFQDNDIEMIIEGIECKADLSTAQLLGIQLGQGYLFSRPRNLEYFM